jgi:class 3 adenylate cyclase
VTDFSLAGHVLDLEAVVDTIGLEKFLLLGYTNGGPVAIAYAASHPERLSHLILHRTFSEGSEFYASPMMQSFKELRHRDWMLYTETVASAVRNWSDPEAARESARALRKTVAQDTANAILDAAAEFDVRHVLGNVSVPTLVIQTREGPVGGVDVAQRLAAGIPGARLTLVDGASGGVPDNQQLNDLSDLIMDFAGRGRPAVPSDSGLEAGASIRSVLFTDLVGHTEMMQRLGDERGRDVLREHERITREVLQAHGGTEVKTMGDGFLASFGSVTRAVECAVALQKTVEEWNSGAGAHHDAPLLVRCGLNAGEPIEEDGDLFGSTVILASRIAGRAEGGEILVADTVRGLCSGKGFLFADRGEFVAKGFDEAVRVSEVKWH